MHLGIDLKCLMKAEKELNLQIRTNVRFDETGVVNWKDYEIFRMVGRALDSAHMAVLKEIYDSEPKGFLE